MRVPGLDGLRVAAVFSVMVIHVAGVAPDAVRPLTAEFLVGASDWCVTALFLVSGFVTARRGHTWPNVSRWLLRLGVPYMVWSSIYFVALSVLGDPERLGMSGWIRVVLLGGAAAHLWFIPALMACHVVGMLCDRRWSAWTLLIVTTPLALLRALGPVQAPFGYELLRYAAPGWIAVYLAGMLLRRAKPIVVPRGVVRMAAVVLPALGGVAFVLRDAAAPWWAVMVLAGSALAGVLVVDVGTGADTLRLRRLQPVSALALGMYLVHMVPIYAAKGLLGEGRFGNEAALAALLLATWVASWLFAKAAEKTPLRRMLVG